MASAVKDVGKSILADPKHLKVCKNINPVKYWSSNIKLRLDVNLSKLCHSNFVLLGV